MSNTAWTAPYTRTAKSLHWIMALIILDVMMPGEDGLSLLKSVREKQSDTPIILLTARNDAADIGKGLVLGADAYITKPYTKNILADVIRRGGVARAAPVEAPAAAAPTAAAPAKPVKRSL